MSEFVLGEDVCDVIVLVVVDSKPIRLKVCVTGTQRQLSVNARDDTLAAPCIITAHKAAGLKGSLIPVEQGVVCVKAESRRALAADKKQVAFRQQRLNGGDVSGLQQLGLEQFAHPGDLVAGQSKIRIGQKPVSRKVGWVGIHRIPSLHQAAPLKPQIIVNPGKA